MEKLFPDVNEARKKIKELEKNLPNKIKNELLEEIPGRISRNISKGAYYINHIVSRFPVFHTEKYVQAVKEVGDLLIAEGYHVEAYIEDYNGYYNMISILISWDIDAVKNDKYMSKQYEGCYETHKKIEQII